MHVVVRSRESGAEGYSVLQPVDISPAADGKAASFQAGILLVNPVQYLHELRVPVHMMGRNHGIVAQGNAVLSHPVFNYLQGVFLIGADGAAAVKYSFQMLVVHRQHAKSQSQIPGKFIGPGNPQSPSAGVSVRHQLLQGCCRTNLRAVCQRQSRNQFQKACQGIFSFLRSGCVGSLALGQHQDSLLTDGKSETDSRLLLHLTRFLLDLLGLQSCQNGLRLSWNYIGLSAGRKAYQLRQCLRSLKGTVKMSLQAAFLNIDYRELTVR